MKRLLCNNCGHYTDFPSPDSKPLECQFCFSEFDEKTEITEMDAVYNAQCTLKLIYQKTGQIIELKGSKHYILGREHIGKEVFAGIKSFSKPVISRTHASITYAEGSFSIKDENSLNGTYVGVENLSCKAQPHKIENNSIIYFGKEVFLVQIEINPDNTHNNEAPVKTDKEEINQVPKVYFCINCGLQLGVVPSNNICPKCSSFRSFVGRD